MSRVHFASVVAVFVLAMAPTALSQQPVKVAMFDNSQGKAAHVARFRGLLTEEKGFAFQTISPDEIQGGKLADHHVLLMPGGSASKQSKLLGSDGRRAVQEYVKDGNGYVGICAGAYLASAEYTWSLHLMNARVIDRKHWARGNGKVELSLSEDGKAVFGMKKDRAEVLYAQGPLLAPGIKRGLPAYKPLALFETEIAKNGAPSGVMQGTTAIASSHYGKGRVLCFSPHPEKSLGPHQMITAAVRWVSAQDAAEKAALTKSN